MPFHTAVSVRDIYSPDWSITKCCRIIEEGCASLVSALKSNPSHLKELDLSNNDLKDTGVEKLSALLMDPQCRLETLRLSGCLVTKEGCASLVSALKSNPSHLKELDLSYNHPGEVGVRLITAGLEDPHWRLEKLNMDHGGEWRLKSGPKKCKRFIIQNTNTAGVCVCKFVHICLILHVCV
uniref:SPRY-associated domain-containing protein n=1 Tax=Esox lucius TaxID=8010 RepID=A0A6Q2YTX8_ESOLU